MQNNSAAKARRLSDPDFQGVIVARSLMTTLVLAFVVVILAAHDAWVWSHPPSSKYFLTDGHANSQRAVPLDSPIVDDQDMLQWSSRWILAPYNVNYHDFPIELNTAGEHYSTDGWRAFANNFIDSGNFEKMKKARLLCFAQPVRAAIVRATEIKHGHLFYAVQMPIVQTCQNVNEEHTSNLMMDATVERVDDDDHPDGLMITALVATPG